MLSTGRVGAALRELIRMTCDPDRWVFAMEAAVLVIQVVTTGALVALLFRWSGPRRKR